MQQTRGTMLKPINRKSMKIRASGRSSDFISPSFGFGCLLNCSYCYMKRHMKEGLTYATNLDDILLAIDNHVKNVSISKPNQTDPDYITYDISCNEDFALHSKYYDWQYIFEYFVSHDKAKATLATKIIPDNFLSYNPSNKVRIRFSLMPQKLSSVLEPNTSFIYDRLKAVNTFIDAGYDVHLNFSPVVVYEDWLHEYSKLFEQVNSLVKYKDKVKAEVIFLTHNKNKHEYNKQENLGDENLLWQPEIQEAKVSQYGGDNIRYQWEEKNQFIHQFKTLHNKIIPWNTIRYIF